MKDELDPKGRLKKRFRPNFQLNHNVSAQVANVAATQTQQSSRPFRKHGGSAPSSAPQTLRGERAAFEQLSRVFRSRRWFNRSVNERISKRLSQSTQFLLGFRDSANRLRTAFSIVNSRPPDTTQSRRSVGLILATVESPNKCDSECPGSARDPIVPSPPRNAVDQCRSHPMRPSRPDCARQEARC